MKLNTWGLVDAFRDAGLSVQTTPGWESRSHGDFPSNPTVIWHHDASPKGDSPGALQWMISNWSKASANLWIDRYGTVFMVGAGISWHAGAVNDPKWANKNSIGIELDLTVLEEQTSAQLEAVRLVTAIMLRKAGRSAHDGMSFHKEICAPRGRKVDPYGLDLAPQRDLLQRLMDNLENGGKPPVTAPTPSTPPPVPAGPSPQPTPQQPAEPYVEWPPPGYKTGQVLERGDNVNDSVRKLQRRLNDIIRFVGGATIGVDGDFGPKTEMWVRWYQAARGLTVDGLVGPATWRELWN